MVNNKKNDPFDSDKIEEQIYELEKELKGRSVKPGKDPYDRDVSENPRSKNFASSGVDDGTE